jgi:Lantibiotic dehydratase, N terminus
MPAPATSAPLGQPGHLVGIEGGWSLWRRICVRSAGFPIAMLDPLGSPLAARAADALSAGATADRRRAAEQVCADEIARIGRYVREVAGNTAFREALTWQNRTAVKTGIDPLLRQPAGASNSKTRQKELLVASYAQRYCAKNDTIGFFGPLGWGELTDASQAVELEVGPELLARRTAYFEHWAIDELARALASDPALRPSLAPRRHPTVRVEGTALWDGRLRRSEIPPEYARLLAACDGTRPARVIAAELAADPTLNLDGEDEVHELLGELADKNLVSWTLEVPTVGSYPERFLDRRLAELDGADSSARSVLAELERERRAVGDAAGDPDRLDRALAGLEETFERLSGRAALRRPGAVYAGRMVVYEDCTRAVDVRLGRAFVDCLGPPLELVLESARWFTWSVAGRYRAALAAAHAELRERHGTAEVDYLRLWERAAPLFPNADRPSPIVAEVVGELRRRWAALLAIEPGERRVARSADELRPSVHEAFAAPGPGWPWARHHCPDVMIAARGPDAAARGDFYLVLGEVHAAVHSYLMPTWVELAPDPAAMVAGHEADIEAACLFPVTSRQQATRVDHASLSRRDLDLEIGDTISPRDRDQVIAVADLVCEEADGRLILRTRDGRRAFDALALFGYYLTAECMSQFRFLPEAAHSPRVTIDRLVVARERWTFAPAELGFCHADSGRAERFLAARAWAAAHSLPRLVFIKIPEEAKPAYVDLESPLYVELLARMVRRASSVSITEMLPGPDEAWLTDAAGRRYASELRIAALDPVPWSPA